VKTEAGGLFLKDEISVLDLIAALERKLAELRASDHEAAKMAHHDLTKRVEEFQYRFATKVELEESLRVLRQELLAGHAEFQKDRDNFLTSEAYDLQHQALIDQVRSIERWQLKIAGGLVFATFVVPVITGITVYFITKGLG
jgi:hypothetical protein